MVCHKTFYCKSTLNRHVKNIHGDRGEKDVCGKAASVGAFDTPSQGDMNDVEKISLAEKDNKEAVLNNTSLSDEQKVVLYNEMFKKDLFKKNKDLELDFGGLSTPKGSLLMWLQPSIENLTTPIQKEARALIQKIEK